MNDLRKSKKVFEGYLEDWISSLPKTSLYEPMAYLLQLNAKRIRPSLVLMAAEMYGMKPDNCIDESLAMEVFHNFTLMHDDIMDDAPLRRGEASVHTKWDVNRAILSGDAMLVKAYHLMSHNAKTLQIFNRYALQVCEGQQLDMDFEKLDRVSLEQYSEMIKLKTAVLLSCSLQIGATIGRATGQEISHLGSFGEQLGMAFQLKDDMLDAFGDPSKVGKQRGGDLRAGKKTWLLIKGLELSMDADRTELVDELQKPAEMRNVIKMAAVLEELGARQLLLEATEKAHRTAMAHMDSISVPDVKKRHLVALAEGLLDRVH